MSFTSSTPRIAFVAAEAFPFAKVGGLADVVGALPLALAQLGLEVAVYMPWYKGIEAPEVGALAYDFAGTRHEARQGEVQRQGVRFVFLRTDDVDIRSAYGAAGEVYAFVRFCMAASRAIKADVVHAHDWQAALLPALVKAGRVDALASVFTVHNLAYQGFANVGELQHWTALAPPARPGRGRRRRGSGR